MLDEMERKDLQVTSMRLLVNGHLIFGFCKKPYEPDGRQLWFSTTKAITGIGVGIACDRGLLSLEDPVLSFFPDKQPVHTSLNLRAMRVRDLLSMSSGIHENTYAALFPQEDWVRAFLAQDFPHPPGTYFRYSTHASHMLSAIVEKASGIAFCDIIRQYLLRPLDIDDMTWEVCRQGITCGGMGLGLTPEAVTRFGWMLLQRGVYKGRRVVSEAYLSQAAREQSDNRTPEAKRHKNGYGFHLCIDQDGSFYHEGSFGQLCHVSPARKSVLVVTSRRNNWDAVMDLVDALFLPPGKQEGCISWGRLQSRLKSLSYPLPMGTPVPPGAFRIGKSSYALGDNDLHLRQAHFQPTGVDAWMLTLEYTDRPSAHLSLCPAMPVQGMTYFIKDIQYHLQKYTAYAVWRDAGTLVLTVFYLETPYEVTYTLRFGDGSLKLDYHINVTFGIQTCAMAGKLTAGGPVD